MRTAAIVTILKAPKMTTKGRKQIANWLRSRAKLLEKHSDLLSNRFVSRYIYP